MMINNTSRDIPFNEAGDKKEGKDRERGGGGGGENSVLFYTDSCRQHAGVQTKRGRKKERAHAPSETDRQHEWNEKGRKAREDFVGRLGLAVGR